MSSARSTLPFFALAFGVTWALQLPGLLAHLGVIAGPPERFMMLLGLGAFGPTIAAMIATKLEGDRQRSLFGRLGIWRVGVVWYAVALFAPGAILAASMVVYNLFASDPQSVLYLPTGPRIAAVFVFPIAEEIGWRGFALPRLLERHRPWTASAILGVAWCLWHIPMLLVADLSMALLPILIVFFIAGSMLFTWLYQNTRGSLLLAVLAHVGVHLNNSHIPLPQNPTPFYVHTVGYVIVGLVLLLAVKGRSPRAA